MALPEAGVSTRVVRPIVAGLLMFGADVEAALAEVKLDAKTLADPDARVPHRAAVTLWTLAVERTGELGFGLRVAEAMDLGRFEVQGYAFLSSANLGEGIERVIRYHRLNHDAAMLTLRREGSQAIYRHELPGGHQLPAAAAQFVIGVMVLGSRAATQSDVPIEEVRFVHDAPPDLSDYARVFGVPVRFSCEHNEVVFSAAALDLPHAKADPGLAMVLDQHASACLAALPRVDTLVDRVRTLLAKELQGGNPSADTTADALGMSTRTLARRLKAEGTSHKEVLDELRAALARRYLGDASLAISEVAFLLGFSEPSAFHRAFKRWTGQTPAEFRSAA
jgi:AraC-like DNA-binding protein